MAALNSLLECHAACAPISFPPIATKMPTRRVEAAQLPLHRSRLLVMLYLLPSAFLLSTIRIVSQNHHRRLDPGRISTQTPPWSKTKRTLKKSIIIQLVNN